MNTSALAPLLEYRESGKPFCVLAGAGISRNMPGTEDIISLVMEAILGNEVFSAFLKNTEDANKLLSERVRFEFILQVVMDYLGDLSFITEIFNQDIAPNVDYHFNLARMLKNNLDVVFTTNFDKQIERAYEKLYGENEKPHTYFKKKEFDNAINLNKITGLVKLHGSIDDQETLGITFDGIVPKNNETSQSKILQRGLGQGALIVVGYRGLDLWDVVPVLEETLAWEQPVFWLHYVGGEEPKAFTLSDVPRKYRSNNSYKILKNMLKNKARDKNKTYLVIGNPESIFYGLAGIGKNPLNRNKTSNFGENIQDLLMVESIIIKWCKEFLATPDGRMGQLMAAIWFLFLLGHQDMTESYANELKTIMFSVPDGPAVAMPFLSMAEYNKGEYDRATEMASRGIMSCKAKLRRNNSIQAKEKLFNSLMNSYSWKSESLRINGLIEQCQETLAEWEKSMYCMPDGIKKHRARAEWYAISGETAMNIGNPNIAEKYYSMAESEYHQAADMNHKIYSSLGVVDAIKLKGDFKKANKLLKEVKYIAEATGWTTWLMDQCLISEMDLNRVVSQCLNQRLNKELNHLIEYHYDSDHADVAIMMKLEEKWNRDNSINDNNIKNEYREALSRWSEHEDYCAQVRMSYAEYLKKINELEEANHQACTAKEYFENDNLPFWELNCKIIIEDIMRMKRLAPSWRAMFNEYGEVDCKIGQLYALIVGYLSGADIPDMLINQFKKYSKYNKLNWAIPLLSIENKNKSKKYFKIVIPGMFYG